MGGSLSDQLLKAGLIDKKKAKKNTKTKNRQSYQVQKQNIAEDDSLQQDTEQSRKAKVARDRELNQAQKRAADQKAIAAQIKQLIETNRINRQALSEEAAIKYSFTDGGKVKEIWVSTEWQQQLSYGRLAIVRLADDAYELVPAAVAAKIQQRDTATVLVLNDRQDTQDDGLAEDDPYADYKIPDDLMW